jgi:hypothetical protein
MPLDFPANPSPNDTYTFGGKTWIWNGSAWDLASAGAINNIPIGNVTANTGNFTTLAVQTGVGSNLIPTANVTFNLGADTARWNDLWLANSTIHIGNGTISANTTSLVLTNPDGTPFEAGGGGSGTAIVNGTSNVDIATANANITMSVDGTPNVVVVSTDGITVAGNVIGNGIATTTVSNTAPVNPEQGDIWIDSDTAVQLIYFSDGNSSQWAEMEAQNSFSSTGGGSVDLTDIASNVLPAANVTYNLGSSANRWNDLWLANSTIYLGEVTISAEGGNLELPTNTYLGNAPATTLGKAIAMSIVFGG